MVCEKEGPLLSHHQWAALKWSAFVDWSTPQGFPQCSRQIYGRHSALSKKHIPTSSASNVNLDQRLLRASPVFIRFFNMVNNNKIQNKPSMLRASIFALDHALSQFYSSYIAKILVENFYCFCYKISERPSDCRAQCRPGTI